MNVLFHRNFTKSFHKLLSKIQHRFEERLKLFIENPTHPILNQHSVEGVYPGAYSINITGDYRAIFYYGDGRIEFFDIGTHARLYR